MTKFYILINNTNINKLRMFNVIIIRLFISILNIAFIFFFFVKNNILLLSLTE